MVNRVNGNYYNDYSQRKSVNTVSDNGEKFSLDYKQENLPSETAKKEENDSKTAKAKKEAAERNGVKLELSKDARPENDEGQREQTTEEQTLVSETKSLIASVQKLFTDVIQYVKDFFYKIWNDAGNEETAEVSETVEAEAFETALQENLQKTPSSEEEILKKALRTGDLPQVIDILTDNGTKTIAKNSTLLTYYDRNGRVVEPSASDKERILHGDRGSRKL